MRQNGLTYGRITSAIIFGLFIAVHAICFAQKSHPLSIRALNAKNGKPIKGIDVAISVTYGKEYLLPTRTV
jgi:hypothetical protein